MTHSLALHRDTGTGPAVVFFHGFPDTAATWDTIADAVEAAGYRVVLAHLRGYNPSPADERGYDAVSLAQDPLRVLDDLGLDGAFFVGHDWGASMLFGAAALAPDRMRGLVSAAIPHPATIKPTLTMAWTARHFLAFKMPWAQRYFSRNGLAGVDAIYNRWAPNWQGPEKQACIANFKAAARDPENLKAIMNYYREFSPTPAPELKGSITCPTLLVGGDRDIVPPRYFTDSRGKIKARCVVEIYEGAGHWPHREDEPRFIADLLAFLKSAV